MRKTELESKRKRKIAFSTTLFILIDIYLIYRLIKVESMSGYFFNFGLLIVGNAIMIIALKKLIQSNNNSTRDMRDISTLLDQMPYAKPSNEEILIKTSDGKHKESVADDSEVIETEDGTPPLVIQKPKSIVKPKAIFDKPIKPIKYTDELFAYMTDSGLAIDKNNIRETFSALLTTKLSLFISDHPKITERYLELFFGFTGIQETVIELTKNVKTFEDLCSPEFSLMKTLTAAVHEPNRLFVNVIKEVDLSTVSETFDKILSFAYNPLIPCDIINRHNTIIETMPHNVWFVLIPKKDTLIKLDQSLAQSTVLIDLSIRLIEPKAEVIENNVKLSYDFFSNILIDAFDQHFIEESEWKKIDQIEQYIYKNAAYKMDNRLFRQFERYTTTLLLFGGDKNQAIDSILYTKLLRLISTLTVIKDKESEDNLVSLCEKLFGLENLVKSKVILKEIQEIEAVEE
ncbi:hypothetical protein [Paracholeplasma manati]|uniref:hypothetical protein n=1 Tax=Paracholeplasma manati TaxID=591373 RepID=UPI0024081508|nr:hypothetical protein [Paracholeplasma manati]MDG0889349.1 hypothetical protein [Paracholeplasma manati]